MQNHYSIGIVGNGFVGNAVANGFSPQYTVKIYDKDPVRSVNTREEVEACDFVFICLPTPESEDGSADIASVVEYVESASKKPVYLLKSTVPVGTTEGLVKSTGLRIIHNPEFLSARTACVDFLTPSQILLGIPDRVAPTDMVKTRVFFKQRFPGVAIKCMHSDTTELAKYTLNSFFFVKLAFFNEIYGYCQKEGLDFEGVMDCVHGDGRVAHSHTLVPGTDGQLGIGGACLPKDIAALSMSMGMADTNKETIEAAIRSNNIVKGKAH